MSVILIHFILKKNKNRSIKGNCPIFSSKGFIDWKPCNISMSTCPNTSYVSDEVYKCMFCCLFKHSDIMCVLFQHDSFYF